MISQAANALLDRVVGATADAARSVIVTARRNLFQRAEDLMALLGQVPHKAADIIADGFRGGAARLLTTGERHLVVEAFGYRVDPALVRIVRGAGRSPVAEVAFLHGNPAITIGNTVYVSTETYDRYHAEDLSVSDRGIGLLIHEFTHVTQYASLGYARFARRYASDLRAHHYDPDELYDYPSRNLDFAHETLEGEAQIVGDYAEKRNSRVAVSRALAERARLKLRGTGIYGN